MPVNCRSIFAQLLCLCALPASAFAQVNVSQEAAGTGDANLPIANLPSARTAAELLGGVPAGGLLLIPDSTNKRVMAFDPVNGDLIDANFVPADDTHLSTPIEALASPDGSRLYVSDQIDDVVQAFDMASGAWVSTFAPAGGVNLAILDNIRGIGYRPNGNLLVSVAGGANVNAVAEFDGGGNYLGNFVAAGAGGLASPFDVYSVGAAAGVLAAGDFLVPGSSSSAVHRYNSSGVAQANFAAVSTFPEQVARAANGNVLVANFSGTEGIFEFTPAGALVASYDPPALSGYRGVHELPNGNLLVTTGAGVHEITRGAALVRNVISGVSARFVSRVAPAAAVDTIYAITGAAAGVGLISFPANAPGTVTNIGALTGIVAGHAVRAIDFRPANGQLYALSTNGTAYQLYTVNLTTAALTPVGAAGAVATAFPARVSIDFNPVVDRIRVVTGSAASYRINPNDGALAATDTNLAYVAGDPNAANNPPFPIGVAYDRNDNDPATATTLFTWDFNTDVLSRVGGVDGTPSPNTGQLTTVFTPPVFITGDGGLGFDVSSAGNAYVSYNFAAPGAERAANGVPNGGGAERFDRLNLVTGELTSVGAFPGGTDVLDISAQPAVAIASADLVATLTDTPDPVNAGSNVSYTATATNNGPDPAVGVSITLPLPAGTTFVSATPSAGGVCNAVSPVVCNWAAATATGAANARSVVVLAAVPANTAAATVLSATTTVATTTADPTAPNNSASTATTVGASADLAITLTDSPDPVIAGTQLTYVATLSNAGPSDAQAATITLPLPAGTSPFSAGASAGGSCTSGNPSVCTWAGATAPGVTRTATVVVVVNSNQTANLSATATASSTTTDPATGNDTATAMTAVQVQSDLSITLADAPDPVTAGTQLTYTAVVSNAGPSDATGVSVSLPLPTGTSFVSGSVTGGGVCGGSPVVCTVSGSMAPATSRTVSIVVLVAPAVLTGTVLNATVTAASASPDPDTANNSASTATNVIASADLVLTLTASATAALINVPVTFTATSENLGPSDAQNASVTITLTPDFRYSGHTATGATCTTPQVGNSGAIVCTWAGAMAPGVTRTLVATAFSNVEGQTAVSASTTSNTTDPVANNNFGNLTVQVGYLVEEIPALNGLGLVLLGLMLGLVGFAAVRRDA